MRSNVATVLVVCGFLMAGCGSTAADHGGSHAGDAGDAAGASGAAGSAEVRCTGSAPSFPEFDRACWDSEWCSIGFHQVDCCGNRVAIGIFHTELEHFEAAEKICQSQYPGCGCPSGPTRADTGQMTIDEGAIKVECRAGICTTYLP